MKKERLQELAGVEVLTEGLTPVNWKNVVSVIANELVSKMKKNDEGLFAEETEYVLNQANEEIMDYIFDKFSEANVRGLLKQAIEREQGK